jgi:integrin-linked kinase-associated serine/threonine phosphatase 2C
MGSLCLKNKKKKIKAKIDEGDLLSANMQIFEANIVGKKKKKESAGQDVSEILVDLGENVKYFAVYDGHGVKGKEAAMLLRYEVSKKLTKDKQKIQNITRKEQVEKYFSILFKNIQKKYQVNSTDYEMSGTCAICILIIETKLYCINLGDSRAVLGTEKEKAKKDKDDGNEKSDKIALEMSIDHKPSRDDEQKRITERGGEVHNRLGVHRVFKKNEESPGLAVSRTMGDLVGHDCGVISEPEVIEKDLEADDKFVVIASDGVWDAMTSSEVVGFIFNQMEHERKEAACKLLVEESRNRWDILNLYKQKYFYEVQQTKDTKDPKNKDEQNCDVDDITAVIHFFNIEA